MDTDQFRRIQELFDAALERAPGDRTAFLDDACGGDEELRSRVLRLLARAEHETPFAGLAPPGATASVVTPSPPPAPPAGDGPGSRIGRYKVLQLIGEGGFGSVYLAEQESPVRRQVALKVIKLGMDTKQVIARFEAERQALAMMDHPNIARVLDAGATDAGRPYFVMDLVRGVPITEYCDLHALSTRERLELFIQVCGAVQHAHQKGIIHRDIKPSNVMVSLQDGQPVPKVIDFGIAKATHQRLTEKTLFTEFHQFVGTPEYMSPEQAEMSGLDVDTRSDIYSLGVLLYELLTGTTPFDAGVLRGAAYAEVQRIILSEEPPKPSTRLDVLATAGAGKAANGAEATDSSIVEIAKRRRTDPASLRNLIRGELDWIVMRAIDKDRRRRYETGKELAEDVQRYLHNEPVLASPPSPLYAGRKFIARHRAIATAVALVLLGLVGGLAVATVGFVRARQERDRAVEAQSEAIRQQQLAQGARDESEAVTQFLAGLLTAVQPGERGRDVTVREVMNEASVRIEAQFRDQPLVEARLRDAIGETYRALGEYASAEPHLLVALEIHEHVVGEEDDRTQQSIERLGHLYWEQGRFEECETLFARNLDVQRRKLGDDHPLTAEAMNNLGVLYRRLGRYDDAERLYRECLEVRRRKLGEDDTDTLTTMNNLALLLKSRGEYEEAEALYETSLEGRRRQHGPEHPLTLNSMNNLASLYAITRRYGEAERLYLETLAVRRRVLGEDHPKTLTSKNNLGYVYGLQGRPAEALPFYVDVLEQRRARLTDDHPNTLDTMHNLATAYRWLGRLEESERLFDEVLERRRRVLGPEHPETLITVMSIVPLYQDLGRLDTARALTQETAEVRRRRIGARHPDTLASIYMVAQIYRAEDRCAEALPLYAEAIQGQRDVLGKQHVELGRTLAGCGARLVRLGRFEQAEETLAEAHRILSQAPPPAPDEALEVARSLVRLYEAWERPVDAAEWRAAGGSRAARALISGWSHGFRGRRSATAALRAGAAGRARGNPRRSDTRGGEPPRNSPGRFPLALLAIALSFRMDERQ